MSIPTKAAREALAKGERAGARRALDLLFENEPGELKLSILAAYTVAKGHRGKAAREMGVTTRVLDEWVAKLGLGDMIAAKWGAR